MTLRRRALLVAPAALLVGCAAPQTTALRAQRPAFIGRRIELTDTPFFPQSDYQCGPAALATVLATAGRGVTPEQLADEVFLPARAGTLQVEMLAGARRHGVLAVRLPGRLESVLEAVGSGLPVVVLQNLGLPLVPRWHYAVLIGHDLDNDELVLRSGRTRRAVMGFTPFEHTWARGGHWAFVVVPPGQVPRGASEESVTEATLAFERLAAPVDAAAAYRAALARWPHSLTLAMGWGNTSHAAGDVEHAVIAFSHAAERHDSAAAWNNLARVRFERGEHGAARDAALRAVRRAQEAEPRWLAAAQATAQAVGAR